MSLTPMTKQIDIQLPKSAKDVSWTRTVAVGSLITGVVLLITGNRKAGVAVAAAGTVFALAEEPEAIKQWWGAMPHHIKTAQQFLSKLEGFVEQMAEQGSTLRRIMGK